MGIIINVLMIWVMNGIYVIDGGVNGGVMNGRYMNDGGVNGRGINGQYNEWGRNDTRQQV